MMPQMTEGVLIAIIGGIVTITQVLLNNLQPYVTVYMWRRTA